jgi:DNA-binding helix-hairpin-helix protein with protein kinase domain
MAVAKQLPNDRGVPGQLRIADQPSHRGGEGCIYPSDDGRYIVKIYHQPSSDKERLLQQIIHLGRNLGLDEQFLAWPLAIVCGVDGSACTGVVTRRVAPTHLPLSKLIYSPLNAAEQFRYGRSWLDYLKIARGTAGAVRTIHGKGMAHADIHLKNVLGDPASGEVVLIDLDGLVVKGFLPPQVKGMPGFIAPEVVAGSADPGEHADRHSAAVLVLWTLLLRNVMVPQRCYDDADPARDDALGYGEHACFSENPDDRRNWISRIGTPLYRNGLLSYRMLTPKLRSLTERALVDGLRDPPRRPQVSEWEQALAEAYDVVVPCSACRQAWCYPYWIQPAQRRQCPFCGSGVSWPLPVVLELLEARIRGSYVPVRPLVLYDGLPLFSDIAQPGQVPPFSRRRTPIIGETVWDPQEGVHRLVNVSGLPWKVVAEGSATVRTGASVPLHPGTLVSFGDDRRVARVVE